MLDSQVVFYLIFAVSALVIGMAKGGFGAAFAALAMPVNELVAVILPFLMLADLFAVGFHWGRWERWLVFLLLPGALAGVAVGTVVLTNVSPETLRNVLAATILAFTLYKFLEARLLGLVAYRPHPWHGVLAGGVSGFTSAIANNGGPPATIYLLLQDLQPRTFIATSALFFFILNYIKVPFYLAAGLFNPQQFLQVAWLLPLVPIGVWIGRLFVDRAGKALYDRVILAILAASAVLLLLT
jgi:hypothetical protein